jgi:peptide/nickel transport system permease protein
MDLNVLSAVVLVGAILIVIANLVVDIVYGFMDPRVAIA